MSSGHPQKEKKPQTLAYKQSLLNGLLTGIEMLCGQSTYTAEKRKQFEALQYGLTTRLAELATEFQHREIDLKIKAFTEARNFLNS